MKKIFIIILFSIMLCGCSNNNVEKKVLNINEIKEIMSTKEHIIIDVRTKEEYETLHIKDAVNIPVDAIGQIDINKNKIIFVYCRSGNRSNAAYSILSSLGYTVYDLGAIDNIDLPKE